MSAEDPFRNTLDLSSGAKFHRCALQVNPHHYAETYRGQVTDRDEESYAEALVDRGDPRPVSVSAGHGAGAAGPFPG